MLSHVNMVSAATSITTYLENTADDVVVNVLPLSFDYRTLPSVDDVQGGRSSGAGVIVHLSLPGGEAFD